MIEIGADLPEAQLQATLNMIPAYTWYAAPSGGLTFVNERCADYLGLPKDHPLRFGAGTGAAWDSQITLLHPDDQEETRRVWSECLSTSRSGEVSFRVRDAHGNYRWFLSRMEPLRGDDGTLLYWIGINLDIEERKQAEFYLAEGQRLAHTGSWKLTAAGFEHWSPELFAIHGLEPGRKAPGETRSLAPSLGRSVYEPVGDPLPQRSRGSAGGPGRAEGSCRSGDARSPDVLAEWS